MSDTQLIKDKLDIVDFIGEYVQLKPAGVNHKGLCPFHGEKTPSFMANRERQSWHCFGCNKGGDIFTFLQEMEGMDFVEALNMLADRAGVTLERKSSGINTSQKNRIKDINTQAARFYHHVLLKLSQSQGARDYLKNRGLSDGTIEEWQIGFVPDQWDLLTQYLLKKGFAIDDLVAAGLTIQRDGADKSSGRGFYDRFRGRIMFPIRDVHGGVVGFTGRVLVETEKSGGKYVNTPQTLVYDKSRVVFGLDKAKQTIKENDLIVMVEGQTDVINSHQAGMKNVVATSGTALTELQIKLLKRYSSNMNMAFDADAAGQKAAKRGIDLALAEGFHIKVITIPEDCGKDPDECIKKNKDVWFESVKNAKHIIDWYISKSLKDKDLSNPRDKQKIVDEVLPEIVRIPYAVERDHWMRELGSKVGVEVGVLREDMTRFEKNKEAKKLGNKETKSNPDKSGSKADFVKNTRLDLLLERLIMVFLKFPDLVPNSQSLISYEISSRYSNLYNSIKDVYNKEGKLDISLLREKHQDDNQENIVDVLLMKGDLAYSSLAESDAKSELESLARQINEGSLKFRRLDLQKKIAEAEKVGDKPRLESLLKEFKDL